MRQSRQQPAQRQGAAFPTPCCAGYVLKCMLSPDVRQLATTSSDKTVKLWNLDGFTLDRTLAGGCLLSLPGATRSQAAFLYPPSTLAAALALFGQGRAQAWWGCCRSRDPP